MNNIAVLFAQVCCQGWLHLLALALIRAQTFTVRIKGPFLNHLIWCDVYPLYIFRKVSDYCLGRDAHSRVIERQLTAGQALWPAVVIHLHEGLTVVTCSLAHRLSGLGGILQDLQGTVGCVHGTKEEVQHGAAVQVH